MMGRMVSAALVVLGLSVAPSTAQQLIGPRLAVAANFSQGWRPDILKASAKIPVLDFRDTVHWAVVEKPGQRFDFRGWRAAFPDILAAQNRQMSLFVNAFHPSYDDGDTAHTDKAVAAFANYAKTTVARFPNIQSVEVGNEFNGDDFVRGPARTQDMDVRAGYYFALMKAVYQQVKALNPDIRVVGGGVHSIPVAYLEKIFALGGADYMDALAIHPYNTPAEHLVRQIAVLRKLPEARDLPIEVTEFGIPNAAAAPGFFLRNYCQMALAGVDRSVWYPMHPRGDGFEPVLNDDGTITPVGRAYGFAQAQFAGKDVQSFTPDAFTYGCLFDKNKLVIWGEPRKIEVSQSLDAFDATGAPLDRTLVRLSRKDPIVLISDKPIDLARDVTLSPQQTLADSFHQLNYTETQQNWATFIRVGTQKITFETMPGQERQSVPWVPYLGHSDYADLRLAPDYLVPTAQANNPVSVAQSYSAITAQNVEIDAQWTASKSSEDGISITVLLNNKPLFSKTTTQTLTIENRLVKMDAGDVLEFQVGPNQNPWGDYTTHRVTLRKATADSMPALGH